MTVDGKITTKNFTPVDFTSREDKMHLLRQRALGDAVLIGHSTLKHDNVRLGLPHAELREARVARGQTPYPLRVIVSNEGRIDSRLKIFQSDISPIVIFSTVRMPPRYQKLLRQKATLHLSDAPSVDLAWMLEQLRSRISGFDRSPAKAAPPFSARSSRRISSTSSISRSRPTCLVARMLRR